MDLNYLYRRHQISLMMAKAAASPSARYSHLGLATAYARLIDATGLVDRTDRPARLDLMPAAAL